MINVFVSGSRSIRALPDSALQSLHNIMKLGFRVLVGDAPGVDALVQEFFAQHGYEKVAVHHVGRHPRTSNTPFTVIRVPGTFQVAKDVAMSRLADYGLAIWDGRSSGTLGNIRRLQDRGVKCKVIRS